jgi:protein-disulfide isomerase
MATKKYSFNSTSEFITNNFGLILISIIFFVVGFFAGSIWTENQIMRSGNKPTQQADKAEIQPEAPTKKADNLKNTPKVTESDHLRGSENPQIYLVEYSDYECTFCSRFHPTMEAILEEYGDKIAWVYRHYPLAFHPYAQVSAETAECIAKEAGNDAFWNYTDAIFAENAKLGGKLSEEAVATAVTASGADTSKVKKCVDDGEMTAVVKEQMENGAKAGISGTPGTILITADGEYELISGALPLEQVKQVVDKYVE